MKEVPLQQQIQDRPNTHGLPRHTPLPQYPNLKIIDGNRFKQYNNIPHTCIVKGDAKFLSIAAASVLAKTYRDDFMTQLNEEYPQYGWSQNKGYPTIKHRLAIEEYGVTPYHRLTFNLTNQQLRLDF